MRAGPIGCWNDWAACSCWSRAIRGSAIFPSRPRPISAHWSAGRRIKKSWPVGRGCAIGWHVLGRRVEVEDRLKVQRNWLWGQTTGRAALVLNFAAGNQPLDVSLVPGTCIDAELVFFPASWPLRALVKERHALTDAIVGTMGEPSLQQAMKGYGSVLACNPWIDRVPLSLEGMTPFYRDGRWLIRDAEGYQIPLSPRLNQGWWIMACSGGNPVGVFGEFDGDSLRPLSLWNDQGLSFTP